jgi:hypothetical protein
MSMEGISLYKETASLVDFIHLYNWVNLLCDTCTFVCAFELDICMRQTMTSDVCLLISLPYTQ